MDKLASFPWRYRRLLAAERAEIQKNTEFLEWDDRKRQNEEAEQVGRGEAFEHENGLISKIQETQRSRLLFGIVRGTQGANQN